MNDEKRIGLLVSELVGRNMHLPVVQELVDAAARDIYESGRGQVLFEEFVRSIVIVIDLHEESAKRGDPTPQDVTVAEARLLEQLPNALPVEAKSHIRAASATLLQILMEGEYRTQAAINRRIVRFLDEEKADG